MASRRRPTRINTVSPAVRRLAEVPRAARAPAVRAPCSVVVMSRLSAGNRVQPPCRRHGKGIPAGTAQMVCAKRLVSSRRTEQNSGKVRTMCGIVGYAGARAALGIVLDGLRRLEYRGYDSAGDAVIDGG